MDCQGKSIIGRRENELSGTNGIVAWADDIEIRNCYISGFEHGILMLKDSTVLEGNTIFNNDQGLTLSFNSPPTNTNILNNYVCGNTNGDLFCNNFGVSGTGNKFTLVQQCADGWPQLGVNYELCPTE